MLTLDQLISEATALPEAAKAILIDKIVESMTSQIDRDILMEGVKNAQDRIAEIESGKVQTFPENPINEWLQVLNLAEFFRQKQLTPPQPIAIPPGTLTGLRGIAKRSEPAPSDRELESEYTDYLTQKYQ